MLVFIIITENIKWKILLQNNILHLLFTYNVPVSRKPEKQEEPPRSVFLSNISYMAILSLIICEGFIKISMIRINICRFCFLQFHDHNLASMTRLTLLFFKISRQYCKKNNQPINLQTDRWKPQTKKRTKLLKLHNKVRTSVRP